MGWFTRKDDEHIQEVVAVEIKEGGQSVGWVSPDVAAALVEGTMSPEQVAKLARQQPDQPSDTQAGEGGLVWEQDNPEGERIPWWKFGRK